MQFGDDPKEERFYCPHCNSHFSNRRYRNISKEGEEVKVTVCKSCAKAIILVRVNGKEEIVYPIFPISPVNTSLPQQVDKYYRQAKMILTCAPEASAALSRCCLEKVLHEKFNPISTHLSKIIDECQTQLPNSLIKCLHALREIGNFALHPRKEELTGEIIEIEPEEAEFSLQVLELVFDYCYEFQHKASQIIESINKKLIACGKQTIE